MSFLCCEHTISMRLNKNTSHFFMFAILKLRYQYSDMFKNVLEIIVAVIALQVDSISKYHLKPIYCQMGRAHINSWALWRSKLQPNYPPDSLRPRSPTSVLYPWGNCITVWCKFANLAAVNSSSSEQLTLPYLILYSNVLWNNTVSWGTIPKHFRSDSKSTFRISWPFTVILPDHGS